MPAPPISSTKSISDPPTWPHSYPQTAADSDTRCTDPSISGLRTDRPYLAAVRLEHPAVRDVGDSLAAAVHEHRHPGAGANSSRVERTTLAARTPRALDNAVVSAAR